MGETLKHQWDAQAVAPGMEYFPEIEQAERAAERQAMDRDDLEKERAGVNVKRSRFSGETSEFRLGQGESDKQVAQNAILMTMAEMATPSYQQAYEQFSQTSRIARQTAEDTLADLQEKRQQLYLLMEQLDSNALRISDGSRAYVGDNGQYHDKDGQVLVGDDHEEAQAAHLENPDATSWKERSDLGAQFDMLGQQEQEVIDYIEELDRMDFRAESGELTEDELEQATQEMIEGAPSVLRERLDHNLGALEADHGDTLAFNGAGNMFSGFDSEQQDMSPVERPTSYAKADGGGIFTQTSLKGAFQLSAIPGEGNAAAPASDAQRAPDAAPQAFKPMAA